ncbi:MAG TPA: tryptophan synthase subunit alpha [Deltaproteobacteria bacterium]|jgi:tryptophan synthase alpha chain|nr:tryptophan synthase subunit alpha [Deltaproteobacteria bacterium]HOI05874.1 tryptophan synthase subunit alpha [Deltaproteobacteria bacterium]
MISQAIRSSKRAVIPYVTAGLRGLDATSGIIRALDEAGAAAIEIGIPFSDPMADGPVLQKASHLALQGGFTFDGLMARLDSWSVATKAPLIIMSYINPLMRRGLGDTLARFRDAGVRGVIIPDLPLQALDIFDLCSRAGIDLIRLVAPTTPRARQEEVVSQCRGFVYAVTVKGVTGARVDLPAGVREQVEGTKALTSLPVCAGFGVSSAAQVSEMLTFSDGVIVGSCLMAEVIDADDPVETARKTFASLMKEN